MDLIKQFENHYVFHPEANKVIEQWTRLHSLGPGKNRGVILSGVPGTGKSELSKSFLNSLTEHETNDRDQMPYIYYELSNNVRPSQILDTMFEILGGPFKKPSSKNHIKAVCSEIHARQVQWVVFDEFQRLLSQSTQTFHAPAVNFISSFIDMLQIPVLLICEPAGLKIVEKNGQTQGRFPRQSKLRLMAVDTAEEFEYYQFFLDELQSSMPWKTTALDQPHMAYRLFAATNGNNRFLKSLLINAAKFADIAQDVVSRNHYAAAFEDLGSQSNIDWNPFDTDIRKVKTFLGVK